MLRFLRQLWLALALAGSARAGPTCRQDTTNPGSSTNSSTAASFLIRANAVGSAGGDTLARASSSNSQFVVGSGQGQDATIAAAVKALEAHDNDGGELTLLITSGTYDEQLRVRLSRASLVVAGDGSGTVNVKHGASVRTDSGHEQGATAALYVARATVRNVNFYNTATPMSQAPAYYQSPDNSLHILENVGLYSMQDTLHAESDIRIRKSTIQGRMDFICGGSGHIVISDSMILASGSGAITASARNNPNSDSVIMISDSTIAAAPGARVPTHSVQLGRTWRPYAHVVIQRCTMSDIVNPGGWTTMASGTGLATADFEECDNTGPGASTSGRKAWKQCSPVDPDTIIK